MRGNAMSVKTVNCPSCSAPVEWSANSKYRPFCSERCKMKDLGSWATEKYKVPQSAREHEETSSLPPERQI